MKFKTPFNYDHTKQDDERITGPSVTVPDETLSIEEIIRRFTKGLPLGGKEPIFLGEDELPDVRRLDLAEIQEIKEANAARVEQLQAAVKENETRARQNSAKRQKVPGQVTKGKDADRSDAVDVEVVE